MFSFFPPGFIVFQFFYERIKPCLLPFCSLLLVCLNVFICSLIWIKDLVTPDVASLLSSVFRNLHRDWKIYYLYGFELQMNKESNCIIWGISCVSLMCLLWWFAPVLKFKFFLIYDFVLIRAHNGLLEMSAIFLCVFLLQQKLEYWS